MSKPTIFVSYSHKDEAEKIQLESHLMALTSSAMGIDLWIDDRIRAGEDWEKAIDIAIARADVAILLITINFLNSEFITSKEVPAILQRRKTDDLVVFPIIGKSCFWKKTKWLSKMNVRPKNGTPVWREQGIHAESELTEIVEEIYSILKDKRATMPTIETLAPRPKMPDRLIYLDNLGRTSQDIPNQAHQLDWTPHFQAHPRQVPPPKVWMEKLLPELDALRQKISSPGIIRLRGSASLAAGFAVGHTFLEVGRYQIQVDQFSDGIVQPWYSNAARAKTDFTPHITTGHAQAGDAAVIILANPRQDVDAVATDVSNYLSREDSPSIKSTLLLESTIASQEKRGLTNNEAVALAENSATQLRRFVSEVNPKTIHLFLAVPLGLAVFMGHIWNRIGCPVSVYEHLGADKIYVPTYTLSL